MFTKRLAGIVVCALLACATPLIAADNDSEELRDAIESLKQGQQNIQDQIAIKQEIEGLKRGQQEIRAQLEEIKKLLAARPGAAAPPAGPNVRDVVFDLGSNPVKGQSTAPLTLIEFTDYQCGFCARHTRQTSPQIDEAYIKTGKLRHATLDFPLENIHNLAFTAAQAARCAGEQGQYWEMHERLFEQQRSLQPWDAHAEALGLSVVDFSLCLNSEKYAEAVRRDMAQAKKAGATGTPSFVLARTDPDNPTQVKGIAFLRGAKPFADFSAEIDAALDAAAN